MFIFLNLFRVLFNSKRFEVPIEFQKVSSGPENQTKFYFIHLFSHYKIWKILGCDILPLKPRRAYNHTGAWKPPRPTNLPSRFHESHSSGVPFDICILALLEGGEGGAFIQ